MALASSPFTPTEPEIDEPPNYLGSFVLNSILAMRYAEPVGRMVFTYGRRAEHAVREYLVGRELLKSYVEQLPHDNSRFLVALRAATHVEQCLGAVCMASKMLGSIHTALNITLPEEGADRMKRMTDTWNKSKHFSGDLERWSLADADITVPVWLSNSGIHSAIGVVTVAELHDTLLELMKGLSFFAEKLPQQIAARSAEAASRSAPP
jgi:hypothetical protein